MEPVNVAEIICVLVLAYLATLVFIYSLVKLQYTGKFCLDTIRPIEEEHPYVDERIAEFVRSERESREEAERVRLDVAREAARDSEQGR